MTLIQLIYFVNFLKIVCKNNKFRSSNYFKKNFDFFYQKQFFTRFYIFFSYPILYSSEIIIFVIIYVFQNFINIKNINKNISKINIK